jgi:hypothetical protein
MQMSDRFWSKVDKTGQCWLWRSAIGGSGYGFFWIGGAKRSEYAHRLAWMSANGKVTIPVGMVIMHSCDNKLCVNPAHLSLGTPIDNKQDSVRKGRHAHGETNLGGGKLSRADADRIRSLMGVVTSPALAREYAVNKSTVLAIWHGKIWRAAAQ